jgi:hypothetical protein
MVFHGKADSGVFYRARPERPYMVDCRCSLWPFLSFPARNGPSWGRIRSSWLIANGSTADTDLARPLPSRVWGATGRGRDPFDERENVDLWDLTRLLLRRWYFAVPMLLLSVTAVVVAAQRVSPDYKANGYMQLIPAPSTGKPLDPKAKPKPTNPWLDLGYAALGNAASLTVTEQSNLERLKKDGFSESVTVVMDDRTPLFAIEAVGNSKEQATGTVRQVIKLLQADIAAKQAAYGTLPEDTISTLVINDGASPQQDSGKVKRVLIVAAGVGVLMTTAFTIALDYWLRRRSRRKEEAEENADEPSTPEPTPSGKAEAPEPATAIKAKAVRISTLESAERTRVLRPVPAEPARKAHANGSVYSSERRLKEAAARGTVRPPNGAAKGSTNGSTNGATKGSTNGSTNGATNGATNGSGDSAPSPDATVILPPSHPARRATDKRP